MSMNLTGNMVWVVTYRIDSKSPQTELVRYTQESANIFAEGIIAAGGVAVVTEDFREVPATEDDASDSRSLKW